MENESPILYYVDKEYLKYLHKEDYRVSVKFNNRPFADNRRKKKCRKK